MGNLNGLGLKWMLKKCLQCQLAIFECDDIHFSRLCGPGLFWPRLLRLRGLRLPVRLERGALPGGGRRGEEMSAGLLRARSVGQWGGGVCLSGGVQGRGLQYRWVCCWERLTLTTLSAELCDLDCGPRGHCQAGHCVCQQGWEGDRCHLQLCDPRCTSHGMCSNGTCLCTNGWNGLHCTLEGCPGNCNGHGTCSMPNYRQQWECLCESGWYGAGCEIRLEQRCDDKIDNDQGKSSAGTRSSSNDLL